MAVVIAVVLDADEEHVGLFGLLEPFEGIKIDIAGEVGGEIAAPAGGANRFVAHQAHQGHLAQQLAVGQFQLHQAAQGSAGVDEFMLVKDNFLIFGGPGAFDERDLVGGHLLKIGNGFNGDVDPAVCGAGGFGGDMHADDKGAHGLGIGDLGHMFNGIGKLLIEIGGADDDVGRVGVLITGAHIRADDAVHGKDDPGGKDTDGDGGNDQQGADFIAPQIGKNFFPPGPEEFHGWPPGKRESEVISPSTRVIWRESWVTTDWSWVAIMINFPCLARRVKIW